MRVGGNPEGVWGWSKRTFKGTNDPFVGNDFLCLGHPAGKPRALFVVSLEFE